MTALVPPGAAPPKESSEGEEDIDDEEEDEDIDEEDEDIDVTMKDEGSDREDQ